MGIKDLLRFMKPYIEPIHIKKYAGKRVGIDAYSWLHKGAYSCSMEICLNTDSEKKLRYLDYFMHRINLLRYHKIVPVVVFDGGNIPCKSVTEEDRHRKRKANRDLAMEKLKEGNVNAASELFQRAVNITSSMAHQLIQLLREHNIEFVVAPYEADAQLAYLSDIEPEKGGIAAVITEDSDLVAYGCKAVVFKMDRYGNGEELLLEKVFDSSDHTPSFRNFDKELLLGMCVLAGCDFLPSVPGIGIAKAYALVSKYRKLDRVLSVLKVEKGKQMPEDYSKFFRQAVTVFQHAQIYDAETKRLKHMKPLPQELFHMLGGELDFLGPELPASIATSIAEGRLDPITMEAFNNFPSSQCHRVRSTDFSKQSCFKLFSSVDAREMHISDKTEEKPSSNKYFNEASAVEKLIFALGNHRGAVDNANIIERPILKVPENNPFKRKKEEEIHLDDLHSDSEHIQLPNEIEIMDVLSMFPEKSSEKRKLNKDQLDEEIEEYILEEVSGLTQVEKSEIVCVTPESQESVNSKKPERVDNGRKRGGMKKQKNSKSSSTILNFFSRI